MKYVMFLLVILTASLVAGAQQPASGQPIPLPSGSAVIADFKGEVNLHAADGSTATAQKGAVLAAETIIETGKGSIVLSLADGSQVLIKSHARVQLQAPEKSQGNFLELFLGNIMAKVQKRLGMEPSFRMGTPTAVITVRGTRFSVEVTKKNVTTVEVYEGLVEVMGLAAPSLPVMIRPGFSTRVEERGGAESPRSMQGDGGEASRWRTRDQGTGNESGRPDTTSPVSGAGQGSRREV